MRPSTLLFPFNPPGVGSAGAITIEKGKSEGDYPIKRRRRRGNRQVADDGDRRRRHRWPGLGFVAACRTGSRRSLRRLRHETRSACDKGQPAQIQCTLTHNTPFDGNAKAELAWLAARCFRRAGRVHKGYERAGVPSENNQGHASRQPQTFFARSRSRKTANRSSARPARPSCK